jgi:hypothetical protein
MTDTPPVLLLGFNRPGLMRGLIDSLRPLAPPELLISLDGPRASHPTDRERVDECKREVERIDWTTSIHTRFLTRNEGLERAIPGAVTWALERHDSVAVVEDDVVVGPDLLDFVARSLDTYRDRQDVWHVSGYNVVPITHLSDPTAPARLSIFPESFAWATWRRAWVNYDPDMTWAGSAGVGELRTVVGSTAAALRWKQIFADARRRRIATWAYRWIGSMWGHGALCVNPNRNLLTYTGYTEGTHTLRRARWSELPLERPPTGLSAGSAVRDELADRYVSATVFRGTPWGVTIGAAESTALALRQRLRRW